MLVTEDGEVTGAISGGCLEGDALRKSLLAIAQQEARLVTYDTSNEEDMSIGVQLGCAGIIQVLFEPIDPQKPANPIELRRQAVSERRNGVMITLFDLSDKRGRQYGTCLFMTDSIAITGEIPDAILNNALVKDAADALADQRSYFWHYSWSGGSVNAFVEFLAPPVSLLIAGAGNDAIPVMNMATLLGWDVRIVDGRHTHASAERFTAACQIVVAHPERALDGMSMDSRTAVLLMTHNYNYDLALLRTLLPEEIPYIGALGPRKKLDRMIADLRASGMMVTDQMLKKVHGPAGLETGAETPEEIALSMLADICATLNGAPGGFLHLKDQVIHNRSALVMMRKDLN